MDCVIGYSTLPAAESPHISAVCFLRLCSRPLSEAPFLADQCTFFKNVLFPCVEQASAFWTHALVVIVHTPPDCSSYLCPQNGQKLNVMTSVCFFALNSPDQTIRRQLFCLASRRPFSPALIRKNRMGRRQSWLYVREQQSDFFECLDL